MDTAPNNTFDLLDFTSEATEYGTPVYKVQSVSPSFKLKDHDMTIKTDELNGDITHSIEHVKPTGTCYYPLKAGVPNNLEEYKLEKVVAVRDWPEKNITIGKTAYRAIPA